MPLASALRHVRPGGEPFAQPKSLEISWRYAANPMALRPLVLSADSQVANCRA